MKRLTRDKYLKKLTKRAKRGYKGEPIATISYYGPDEKRATKVSVGIFFDDERGVQQLERWYNDEQDVRRDATINEAIFNFIERHDAKSVVRMTKINGCPHEEGIDYPEGEVCPECDFWAGKERLTDRIQRMVSVHKGTDEEE